MSDVTNDPVMAWYEARRKEAEEWSEALAKARANGAPPAVIKDLERRLERARYVGD